MRRGTYTRTRRKTDTRKRMRSGGRWNRSAVCFIHNVLLTLTRWDRYCPLCYPTFVGTNPSQLAAKRKRRDRRGQSKPR